MLFVSLYHNSVTTICIEYRSPTHDSINVMHGLYSLNSQTLECLGDDLVNMQYVFFHVWFDKDNSFAHSKETN